MIYTPRLKGRRRVELDFSKADFLENPKEILKKYLGSAMSIHRANVIEMKIIHEQLVGNQSIYTKTRSDNSDINNMECENHLYPIWRFKTSYIVGRPIQYSNKGGEDNDDMRYFNRYLEDSKKAQNDVMVYNDVYEYGIGHRMLIPNTNKFDDEYESPLKDIYLDSTTCFICYSSGTLHEQLFSCIVNKKRDRETKRPINVYTIYFTDFEENCYSLDMDSKGNVLNEQKEVWSGNPVIEYIENKYRLGVIETILSLQNIINHLDSSQLDDIDQFIEAFLVFMNIDVDLETDEGIEQWKKQLELYKKTRAMVLSSQNEQMPADFKQMTNSLEHTAINALHDRIKTAMYDIARAPQSSGSVTSGGDTTGARMLGNGWESALSDAELTTTFLKGSEYEWVKIFVRECKRSSSKIDEIYPSEIEIKYNINMSDNALVKTQAISNLYNANMPKDLILTAVPILSDVYKSSKAWEEYDNTKKQESQSSNVNQKVVTNEQINDLQNKGNN